MLRSFQTRLELSDRQATVIARHAGYSPWIYNWALRLCGEVGTRHHQYVGHTKDLGSSVLSRLGVPFKD